MNAASATVIIQSDLATYLPEELESLPDSIREKVVAKSREIDVERLLHVATPEALVEGSHSVLALLRMALPT